MSVADLRLRLGLLYGALFAVYGVNLPFLPLWLEARGADPAQIGLLVGLPVIVRVIAAPLVTDVADRLGRPVRVLRIAAGATLAGYVLLAWTRGFTALLMVSCLLAAASAAILPLCDSLLVAGFRSRQRLFGSVRLWGSVSFVAGSAIAGIAVDAWSVESVVWLLAGLQAAGLAAAFACVPDAPRLEGRAEAPPARHLFVPGLLVALGASALIQASHAAFYALGPVHWRAAGFDGPVVGLLWSIGVVAEIGLFFGSAFMPGRIGAAHLLSLGAGAAVVRWAAMAADPGLFWLVPLQALHGFSYGATFLGMMRAAAQLGKPGLEARVQGMTSTVNGLAMAGAMALAGPVYAAAGPLVYGVMAVIAGLGGLVAFAGRRGLRSTP